MTNELITAVSINPITLKQVLEQAQEIQDKCSDYYISNVSNQNMRYQDGLIKYVPNGVLKKIREVPLTNHAFSQLCGKAEIPVSYMRKCIDKGFNELVNENINEWYSELNKNLMIREYDNSIRGILSDKYMVLDTPDILRAIPEELYDEDKYNIKGHFIDSERLHLRLVQKQMLNIPNEDLFAGIQIDSSDVGKSTLSVTFIIFKQICTNGLCIAKGEGVIFKQKHIGINHQEFRRDFQKAIANIPNIINNAEQHILKCISETKGYSISEFTEEEMNKFKDKIKLQTKLSDEAVNNVIELMDSKYDHNKWGYINSITEVAQKYSLERRIDLEKIAGSILVA